MGNIKTSHIVTDLTEESKSAFFKRREDEAAVAENSLGCGTIIPTPEPQEAVFGPPTQIETVQPDTNRTGTYGTGVSDHGALIVSLR